MILTIARPLRRFWLICLSMISSIGFCYLVVAQEAANLPPAPSTGTPEGTSSAGGTRSEPEIVQTCETSDQSLVYLLDSGIRDFTLDAYPVFWFYNPYTSGEIAYWEFALAEVQTEKTIYHTVVNSQERAGIMGIALPQQEIYALEQDKDYLWSLRVYCGQQDDKPSIVLEGWVHRLPLNPDLEQELATYPTSQDAYPVYIDNNIFYDALTSLARLRQQKPQNRKIIEDWDQFLTDLGWQELTRKPILNEVVYSSQE